MPICISQTKGVTMTQYSFTAECLPDVIKFIEKLSDHRIPFRDYKIQPSGVFDVSVEMT